MAARGAGLYQTRDVLVRLLIVTLVALGSPGCLPEPDRPPGDRFDAGMPIDLDAPPVDTPALDAPPVDRPVVFDVGRDVVATDASQARSDGPDLTRRYPAGPYGTIAPQVMVPFQLANCGSGLYRFDGPDWVPAWGTVVQLTNGYCADCEEAARLLQREVVRVYQPMGIRFVTVLIDGESPGDPPSAGFCRAWATTVGIVGAGAVPHATAIDLGGMLQSHTPPGLPPPQWVLTDENGRIVWRGLGSARSATTLVGHIRNLLGLPP